MQNKEDIRVKSIHMMLLEMAKGNFYYNLEFSNENDHIEATKILLNMVSEEINASFIHQGFAHAPAVRVCILQMSFVMDTEGMVEMINPETAKVLHSLPGDIIGKPLTKFLTTDSQRKWKKNLATLVVTERSERVLQLEFLTGKGLIVTKECSMSVIISTFASRPKILLNAIFFTKGESLSFQRVTNGEKAAKDSKIPRMLLSHKDVQIFRKVRDLILCNLDKELPKLRELALQMGTNEYKLKYGFKELYGTTVFRFLTQERLRQAKVLILQSKFTLRQIAARTGFKSTTHFSRAFKERYGVSPNELRKREESNE